MSKSYRKEVLKRLNQELNATTDTKEIIRIGNTIAKLTKPKNRVGRPRTKKPTESAPSGKNGSSAVVAKWADRISHVQPEAKRIQLSWQLEVEKRYKSRGIQLYPPSPDCHARLVEVMVEVMGELSSKEQAILEALNSASQEVV